MDTTTGQNPIADATESVNQTDLERTEDGYTVEYSNGITVKRYEPNYQPAHIPMGMSLELALWRYDFANRRWKESAHCTKLIELFNNTIMRLEHKQITECLAIGLGTFTSSNPYGSPSPESSLYQLAVFETIVKLLKRKFPGLKSSIQDPVMNSLDEELVRSRGFAVLHHPEALSMTTSTTFLYTPGVPWTVIQGILETASPALYLGDRLDTYLDQVRYEVDCCEKTGHTGKIIKTWHEALTTVGITICDESAKRLMKEAKEDEKRFNTVFKPYTDGKSTEHLVLPYIGQETITLTLYWGNNPSSRVDVLLQKFWLHSKACLSKQTVKKLLRFMKRA